MKAFVVGFPKSGTSTLHRAVSLSGWRAAHWYVKSLDNYVGRMMYRRHYEGVDPLLDFAAYDMITQADLVRAEETYWPQFDPAMLQRVREFHPQCIFVLNYRDPAKLTKSICRWHKIQGLTLQERLAKCGAPGLPMKYAKDPANIEKWIRYQYAALRRSFDGDSYFLEYDIDDPDAPMLVGERLGLKINWWGVANENPEAVA